MEKLKILPEKGKVVVVGDIHGDLNSFEKILKKSKFFKSNKLLLCLGDYGDRGRNSVEVYDLIFSLLKKFPSRVFFLKGNHEKYIKIDDEIRPTFTPCTLLDELKIKHSSGWKEIAFKYFEFWERLPIAAIVLNKYLFVHGGVSTLIQSIDNLRNPSEQIEEDIIWSDPSDFPGEYLNPRGAGKLFGLDVTEEVCERLGVKIIIRSHQPSIAMEGASIQHDKILTISSTTVYGGKAAYLEVDLSKKIKNVEELFDNVIKV